MPDPRISGAVHSKAGVAIFVLATLRLLAACGRVASDAATANGRTTRDTAVVYLAASLVRPLAAALDSFSARTGTLILRESGGSLEHARKITELHRIPDVLALADAEVFPQLLMPAHVHWYAEFARNRMVIAFTDRSRDAARIDSINWPAILGRPGVEVGRTDPGVAPVGYRALLVMQLAERHYRQPGLATRLLANAPRRNMRANAAELAALLESGELDYIYDYESVAHAYHLRSVALPAAIDLGDPSRAAAYGVARVRVRRAVPDGAAADSATVVGAPIVYALSVPTGAPHRTAGERLAAFLLSRDGRAMMRAARVDAIDGALLVGDGIPQVIRDAAR